MCVLKYVTAKEIISEDARIWAKRKIRDNYFSERSTPTLSPQHTEYTTTASTHIIKLLGNSLNSRISNYNISLKKLLIEEYMKWY